MRYSKTLVGGRGRHHGFTANLPGGLDGFILGKNHLLYAHGNLKDFILMEIIAYIIPEEVIPPEVVSQAKGLRKRVPERLSYRRLTYMGRFMAIPVLASWFKINPGLHYKTSWSTGNSTRLRFLVQYGLVTRVLSSVEASLFDRGIILSDSPPPSLTTGEFKLSAAAWVVAGVGLPDALGIADGLPGCPAALLLLRPEAQRS